MGYYCPVGRNSERRSKGFGASDTVLGIEKHELTVCNAAHGIQYVTLKFISLPSVDDVVKLFLNCLEFAYVQSYDRFRSERRAVMVRIHEINRRI